MKRPTASLSYNNWQYLLPPGFALNSSMASANPENECSHSGYWAKFRDRLIVPYFNSTLAASLGHQLQDLVGGKYYFNCENYSATPSTDADGGSQPQPFRIKSFSHSVHGNCFTFMPQPRTYLEMHEFLPHTHQPSFYVFLDTESYRFIIIFLTD